MGPLRGSEESPGPLTSSPGLSVSACGGLSPEIIRSAYTGGAHLPTSNTAQSMGITSKFVTGSSKTFGPLTPPSSIGRATPTTTRLRRLARDLPFYASCACNKTTFHKGSSGVNQPLRGLRVERWGMSRALGNKRRALGACLMTVTQDIMSGASQEGSAR